MLEPNRIDLVVFFVKN